MRVNCFAAQCTNQQFKINSPATQNNAKRLAFAKISCLCLILCVLSAIPSSAQTFTGLVSFAGKPTNGANPDFMSLVQGVNGNFYGTTYEGGTAGVGTIFKITPSGTLTTLVNFPEPPNTIGYYPIGGLVLGSDGNFYGTTSSGGASSDGTVFKMTPGGTLTTVYAFTGGTDGSGPQGPLVQATDGNFYGTTEFAGANNYGTVFQVTPGGTLTTLHSFAFSEGTNPVAGLIQANDGNLYGTASSGASADDGSVFQITLTGTFTVLHTFSFSSTDSSDPFGQLVQGTDLKLYGTTVEGGSKGYGTVYSITTTGTYALLHSFDDTDGNQLYAGLVLATDGNFYGTTRLAGTDNDGTIFQITSAGTLTTLHSFDLTDGQNPTGGLLQATDGNFYGTTYFGGANNFGTVFKLANGLSSYVKINPTSGPTGQAVTILGTGLTGASSVKFNGTAATFTVVSSSEITTTVPTGATTGTVSVTTSGGTLNSNVPFTVTGSGTGPTMTLSVTSMSFGNEALNNTSTAKTVTVTNTGTVTLDINSITISGDFAISANTCGTTLAAGKTCKVSVTFTPVVLGALTGTLTFNDNASNSPQTVALSGTGVEPATISPTSYTFKAEDIGVTSAATKFTLTNNQSATLSSISSSVTGDFAISATTCSTTLASKKSCTISVTFTPTVTGTRTGTLTVKDNASNSPQTASLTGTGNNPKPTITSLSPSSATAGGAQFTLTVNGTGFVSSSVVNWAGSARATTYVSSTKITAIITATDIATAGTFKVTVANPAPGGGTSASSNFTVNNPAPTLTKISPSSATHGGPSFTLTATGTGYVAKSKIQWNGVGLTTTFVSSTSLTATVSATDIKNAGTASVTVNNPTPGGGTSAAKTFTIN